MLTEFREVLITWACQLVTELCLKQFNVPFTFPSTTDFLVSLFPGSPDIFFLNLETFLQERTEEYSKRHHNTPSHRHF